MIQVQKPSNLGEEAAKFTASAPKKDEYLVKVKNKWVILKQPELDSKTRALVSKSFNEMKKELSLVEKGVIRLSLDSSDTLKTYVDNIVTAADANKANYTKANVGKKNIGKRIALTFKRQTSKAIETKFDKILKSKAAQGAYNQLQVNKLAQQTKKEEAKGELAHVAVSFTRKNDLYKASPNPQEKAKIYKEMTADFKKAKELSLETKSGMTGVLQIEEIIVPIAREQLRNKMQMENYTQQLKDVPEDDYTGEKLYIRGQVREAALDVSEVLTHKQINEVLKDFGFKW